VSSNDRRAREYRLSARELRSRAGRMALDEARSDVLKLAESYDRLAANLETAAYTDRPVADD